MMNSLIMNVALGYIGGNLLYLDGVTLEGGIVRYLISVEYEGAEYDVVLDNNYKDSTTTLWQVAPGSIEPVNKMVFELVDTARDLALIFKTYLSQGNKSGAKDLCAEIKEYCTVAGISCIETSTILEIKEMDVKRGAGYYVVINKDNYTYVSEWSANGVVKTYIDNPKTNGNTIKSLLDFIHILWGIKSLQVSVFAGKESV